MKTLVLGSKGQVGRQLLALRKAEGMCRKEVDLLEDRFLHVLDQKKPQCIINAAAYTHVDQAEKEQSLAMQMNAFLPKKIAHWCAKNDALLIHYSTDYVFDGQKAHCYQEEDPKGPLNTYGASKLLGEKYIQEAGCAAFILRTSRVFSETASTKLNFVLTLCALMQQKKKIAVVTDQRGSPTYARDLADITWQLWDKKRDFGVYHVCNTGVVSFYDFACRIQQIKGCSAQILPQLSAAYPSLAKRPLNVGLGLHKLEKTFGIVPRSWEYALTDCLAKIPEGELISHVK